MKDNIHSSKKLNVKWTSVLLFLLVWPILYFFIIGPAISYGETEGSHLAGIGALASSVVGIIVGLFALNRCRSWLKTLPIFVILNSLLLALYGWFALTFYIQF